ncbi:PAS domain-containing protein [Bradyrhizobium sediminis]|uniref:histidine kinase n=1 Tax=Bradyrhizobium sediminis TaxID=2840469 RepID=A0A975NXM0_9BRAD|nr:PAS domain-containing protein [Bradyrhizobium sediminis]QWG23167.1 PAS domain-containing protein [Bradyrhizobium sediminis]
MLVLFDGDLGERETLRFIEEKLHAGIWSWDLATGDMEWSHGFFSLLGIEPDSIKPSSTVLSQMVHPDDRPPSEAVSRTLNEGLPAEWEFRIIRPNGRIRWIATRSELLLDSDGHPVRSIGVSFDVTKRHELLQSLDIASGRYDALIRAAQGIVWFGDKSGNITKVLRPDDTIAERPMGRQSEHWTDFVHPDENTLVEGLWRQAALSRNPYRFEHRIRQRDNSYRWARTIIVQVFSRRGEPLELIGLSTDIEIEKRYSQNSARPKQLTGAQIRAARGMLALSVKDLAEKAAISPTTIRRYEQGDGPINSAEAALEVIERTLAQAGIEFIFPELGKPGIRPR